MAISDLPAVLGVVKGVTSSAPTNHRLAGSRCSRMRRRVYKRRGAGDGDCDVADSQTIERRCSEAASESDVEDDEISALHHVTNTSCVSAAVVDQCKFSSTARELDNFVDKHCVYVRWST